MLNANYRLTVLQNGVKVREPVLLTEIGLRETLLKITDFDEVRVNLVCKTLKNLGKCEMSTGRAFPLYLMERVDISPSEGQEKLKLPISQI